eukprot:scaffold15170_cov137-Isochrysis_galbana.AAC.3
MTFVALSPLATASHPGDRQPASRQLNWCMRALCARHRRSSANPHADPRPRQPPPTNPKIGDGLLDVPLLYRTRAMKALRAAIGLYVAQGEDISPATTWAEIIPPFDQPPPRAAPVLWHRVTK